MEEIKWRPANHEPQEADGTKEKEQPKTESIEELLEEAIINLKHAQVFISSSAKMHPVGRQQHQECIDKLEKELKRRTTNFCSIIKDMMNKQCFTLDAILS